MNDDLLEEAVLRRALRLDPDERPRVQLAAVLASTEVEPLGQRTARALALGTMALGAAGACLAALGLALELVATVLSPAAPAATAPALALLVDAALAVARVAADPSVPIAVLVALIVALYHERVAERNGQHARAS